MTGTSTTAAPSSRSRATSADAWARARVTTTVRPNSGRRSNQSSSWAATSPDDDHRRGRQLVVARASPSVARTVRCSGRVPHWTAAAGVSRVEPARDQPLG